jgi:hypothetical protein
MKARMRQLRCIPHVMQQRSRLQLLAIVCAEQFTSDRRPVTNTEYMPLPTRKHIFQLSFGLVTGPCHRIIHVRQPNVDDLHQWARRDTVRHCP